jgi:hypothetical protein
LDSLHSLGIDALLLPAPSIPTQATPDPILDDFDELIRQASSRGMRILLTLPAANATTDLSGTVRFWLTRGVAGLHVLVSSPADAASIVPPLRKITGSIVGQRIILSDFAPATIDIALPVTNHTRSHTAGSRTNQLSDTAGAQLQVDARISTLPSLDATSLRPLLAQTLTQPNLLLDFHQPTSGPDLPLAKAMATILLTLHSAAVINADAHLTLPPNTDQADQAAITDPTPVPTPPTTPQPAPQSEAYVPYVPPPRPVSKPVPTPPPPADPLTNWYRQLSELHHANAVLRSGITTFVDFDQQNALVWVAHPATASLLMPPIVVACNLSATPVTLSIGAAIKSLNLHGTYLRTLLRSDTAMGPQDLNGVILPPYSVYIGELHR